MITKIDIADFRGTTRSLDVGKITKIVGKNKAGKTTIREAICFALTGTDSRGTRAPIHLISEGKNQAKISITTSKSVISRTLNRKSKSGTLKLSRDGIDTPLTQSQLDGLVAPKDLFLSVFVPEYFLGSAMNPTRRLAVLSSVLPKIDRRSLVEDLLGERLSVEEMSLWGNLFSKRPDQMATKISETRRNYQKQHDMALGSIREIKNLSPVPVKPERSPLVARHAYMKTIQNEWDRYEADMRLHESRKLRVKDVVEANKEKLLMKAKLEKELSSLQLADVPCVDIRGKKAISSLEAKKQELPAQPATMSLTDNPHCHSCGQVVGKAHRERVSSDNAAAKADWESRSSEVRKHNKSIDGTIGGILEGIRKEEIKETEAINFNVIVNNKKEVIRAKMGPLVESPVPESSKEPESPNRGAGTVEDKKEAAQADLDYNRDLALYDDAVKKNAGASERAGKLEADRVAISTRIDRCLSLEECILKIPQEELRRQADFLSIDGYILDVSDDVRLKSDKGMPSDMMSYGERMKACNALSLKLNSLMPRRLNMMFLDNAESNDDIGFSELSGGGRQIFAAYMDASVPELTVKIS